ncbi:MAG: aldose epimerase family protein [Litoreibacter sp.]
MNFGLMPDGDPVERYIIRGGGLTANLLSYGAILQDLQLDGHGTPLVLGFETFEPYLTDSPFFGAVAGRCANRVRNGRFEIDQTTFQTDQNYLDSHMLHGGARGSGKVNWDFVDVASDSVTLRLKQPDGDMGFPGNLVAHYHVTCMPGGVLDLVIEATTDKPTLCNFAHHSYWNLDGSADTGAHLLQVDAAHYTGIDDAFIPTGKSHDVTGTRFDFRTERPINDDMLIDHNLCLSNTQRAIRKVGHLRSEKSGVTMEIRSTEPGIQVYDGFKLDVGPCGLGGRKYGVNGGIALEPQNWPDAINHSHFPDVVLRPGETYRQHTQFAFSKG